MPKTLYARRPLKNVADIEAWAKANGLVLQDGAHVTIAFSKNPIEWPKLSGSPEMYIPDAVEQLDGTRSIERLGEGAVVLRFESKMIAARWQQLRDMGASWDFDEYRPHITICYDPDAEVNTNEIEPWQGPLVFGPEVFEEVKVKPELGMDEMLELLLGEVRFQQEPELAYDRAPEGLKIDRPGILTELAFDRDTSQGRTEDGFQRLHVKHAPITKACVSPYYGHEIPKGKELGLEPNKIYQLLRDPEEIKKGAASSHNIPLLDEHVPHSPDDHDGDITVGTVGSESEYEHPILYNSLAVWSRDGIDHVHSGDQKELSSAYGYDADMTPGTYEGKPYDGVMRNMKFNHVCMVKKGRVGSDIALDEALQPLSPLEEILMSNKAKLKSAKATVAYGALTAFLKPKLAQDAQINLHGALATFEPKKFKASIPNFVAAMKKSLKGKLAQDGDIAGIVEGVQKLMESIDADKMVEDSEDDNNTGTAGDNPDDTSMDGGMAAVKAYLKSKGVADDVIAGMPGAEAEDADPDDDDEAKKKDDELKKKEAEDAAKVGGGNDDDDDKKKPDFVSKGAMDQALKKTAEQVRKDTIAQMQGVAAAVAHVEPITGHIDMAFDSAEGVYRQAFKMQDRDVSGIKEVNALKAMWDMIPVPGARAKREPIAQDSDAKDNFAKQFPNMAKVKRA
jgi:hypothetical protein